MVLWAREITLWLKLPCVYEIQLTWLYRTINFNVNSVLLIVEIFVADFDIKRTLNPLETERVVGLHLLYLYHTQ